jgi:hypothetical protein
LRLNEKGTGDLLLARRRPTDNRIYFYAVWRAMRGSNEKYLDSKPRGDTLSATRPNGARIPLTQKDENL